MTTAIESTAPRTITYHRWSLEDWDAMIRTGVLGGDDHVELLEGEIVEISPIGPGHAGITACLSMLLAPLVIARRAGVVSQNPLRISRLDTEFYPDLLVLHWRDDLYVDCIPEAAEAVLVIEIADTSLAYDLGTKVPIYARASIPEAWVVDANRGCIHVFRRPVDGRYTDVSIIASDSVRPELYPDIELPLAQVFRKRQ